MTFQDAVRKCLDNYVTISGRARRAEYWWWVLFVFLGNTAGALIDGALFGFSEGDANIIGPLFSLAIFLPTICVAGRRLHDRDMSAWWLLLMLIPVVGALVLLVLYLLPGTQGSNRFGPDPLAPDDPAFRHRQSPIPRVSDAP